jgi:hypothetical protein
MQTINQAPSHQGWCAHIAGESTMANSIVQPYKGPTAVDLSPVADTLVAAVPGATRGLRREKDGIQKVLGELQQGLPVHASTLGLAAGGYDRIAELTEKLDKVREVRVLIDKLAGVLEETEAYLEDERESEIALIVSAARATARRKDPTIIAAFEETIRYHGQVGARAAKTRRKNAEQAEAPAEGAPHAVTQGAMPAAQPQ